MSGTTMAQRSQAGHPDAPQAVFLAYALVVLLWLLYTHRDVVKDAVDVRVRGGMARLRARRPGWWPNCSGTAPRRPARSRR
jgi:hypothetical protein